jgi:transcriptional regulator with XRE-family HTH domain
MKTKKSTAANKQPQYRNVADMVRNLSDDQAFADEFMQRLTGRQFIKALTVLRTRAGLSQQELAEKLECTQSKVSKLESGADADIRFGDLVSYTGAVGHEMRILLVPKGLKLVDEVKVHALLIKRLLDKMVQLAGRDGTMTGAVAAFLEEAAFNLTRIVKKAAATLPALPEHPAVPLQVEAPELEEEERPAPDSAGAGLAEDSATGTRR